MQYRVVSVKGDSDRESVLIYAAEREDALKLVPGLFASPPVPLGEVLGMSLHHYVQLWPLTSHFQDPTSLGPRTVLYSLHYTSRPPRHIRCRLLPPRMFPTILVLVSYIAPRHMAQRTTRLCNLLASSHPRQLHPAQRQALLLAATSSAM